MKDLNWAKLRVEELRVLLRHHNHLYHSLDRPEITDREFDALFEELQKLEGKYPELRSADSPTQKIGGEVLERFEKQDHRLPMLSLQNSYSTDEIEAYFVRAHRHLGDEDRKHQIEWFCEPKFDGLAIELVYEQGRLTSALTRGDGTTGENVVSNVRTIRSLPSVLPADRVPEIFEVRGEILLEKKDFLKLNEDQLENGLSTFANARNAAAGTLRQLNSSIAAQRPLKLFCYSLGFCSEAVATTQAELLTLFRELELPTVAFSDHLNWTAETKYNQKSSPVAGLARSTGDVMAYYNWLRDHRTQLAFDIDGIVVKANSFLIREELGFVARSPRWAIAAKFEPDRAQTKVLEILVQVGRTGALTPVAILEPVVVGGVTVTHATLHNPSELKRKDVRIGDWVWVHRAGDVIPEIIEVDLTQRGDVSPFSMPMQCPACGSLAEQLEDEVILRCLNSFCPGRVKEAISHFVSRKAMNIDKLGEKITETLLKAEMIKNISDLYRLTKEDLLQLDRQGEKSATNLIESIERSKKPRFDRFLYALGIRFVGEQTAKTLALSFSSWAELSQATQEDFIALRDIGDKVAHSLFEAISSQQLQSEVQRMFELGVEPQPLKSEALSQNQVLKGLSIVVTGSLPWDRQKIKDTILKLGGSSPGSVSKKTNFVLAGEDAGSKLEKASQLNIPVLSWEAFIKMIEDEL